MGLGVRAEKGHCLAVQGFLSKADSLRGEPRPSGFLPKKKRFDSKSSCPLSSQLGK